jgi:hypothetical protein
MSPHVSLSPDGGEGNPDVSLSPIGGEGRVRGQQVRSEAPC